MEIFFEVPLLPPGPLSLRTLEIHLVPGQLQCWILQPGESLDSGYRRMSPSVGSRHQPLSLEVNAIGSEEDGIVTEGCKSLEHRKEVQTIPQGWIGESRCPKALPSSFPEGFLLSLPDLRPLHGQVVTSSDTHKWEAFSGDCGSHETGVGSATRVLVQPLPAATASSSCLALQRPSDGSVHSWEIKTHPPPYFRSLI